MSPCVNLAPEEGDDVESFRPGCVAARAAQPNVEFGGGLTYANECCQLEFFVKRDFRESDDAPDSTSFGVLVRLFTLGNQDNTTR